jgi:hypothetical protein
MDAKIESSGELDTLFVCIRVGTNGSARSFHRGRARPRRRSIHASPLCRVGPEGTAAHLRAHEGGPRGEEGNRSNARQPNQYPPSRHQLLHLRAHGIRHRHRTRRHLACTRRGLRDSVRGCARERDAGEAEREAEAEQRPDRALRNNCPISAHGILPQISQECITLVSTRVVVSPSRRAYNTLSIAGADARCA